VTKYDVVARLYSLDDNTDDDDDNQLTVITALRCS